MEDTWTFAAAAAGAAAAAYLTLPFFRRGADVAYKRTHDSTTCFLPGWLAGCLARAWLPPSGRGHLASWLLLFQPGELTTAGGAEPVPLPEDLLVEGKSMWENLDVLERHLGAHDMTSCEAMVVAHEQITALDPEYVNLFTVQVRDQSCGCCCGGGGGGRTSCMANVGVVMGCGGGHVRAHAAQPVRWRAAGPLGRAGTPRRCA
jgi:hypothetical protein